MSDEDVQENELMADLEASWAAAEQEEANNEAAATEGVTEAAPIGGDAEVERVPVDELAEPQGGAAEGDQTGQEAAPVEASQQDDAPDLSTAPKGLSPAAREAWEQTPEAIKADIAKRERDFENGIQQYAENAQRAQQMDQVLAPYQSLFALNGGAGNTLPGLLQTAQALQTGSDHVRAQTIANLIQQFGVPVPQIADVLEGKATTAQLQTQQPVNIQAEVERLFREQQQQDQAGQIKAELARFSSDPKNEFLDDVSPIMARLFDIASAENRRLTYQEAYDEACQINPEVRQILQARQAASELAARRGAATSISGAPQGQEAPPQPETVEDYLRQAWDQVGNA